MLQKASSFTREASPYLGKYGGGQGSHLDDRRRVILNGVQGGTSEGNWIPELRRVLPGEEQRSIENGRKVEKRDGLRIILLLRNGEIP